MKRKAIKAMLVSALAVGSINSNVVFAEDNNLITKTDDSLVQVASASKGQVVNVSVNLNIRKSASTSSTIVGKMPANATFDIISKSGTWYKIKYGNIEGYVSGDYVKVIGSSSSNETVNTPSGGSSSKVIGTGQVVNVSVNLNIRKSTSTSSAIVGKMPANAKFDILAKSGTWYKIKYGNIEGYVSGDYVKVISSSNTTGNGGSAGGTGSTGSTGSGNSGSEAQVNGKGQVVNVSVNLNIRKSTSTSSAIVGKMPANATFDIIAKSGTWYKIKYGSVEGYVSGEYVKIISSSSSTGNEGSTGGSGSTGSGNAGSGSNSSETQVIGKGQVVNVSVSLNIRKSTSTSSAIVGKMPANATFDIIAKSGAWYKIKYGNIEGYVSGDYVKVISSSSSNDNNTVDNEEVLNNKYGVVIGLKENESLKVRKEPNMDSDVLGYLTMSQKVKLESKIGNWYKISLNGTFGYIGSSYIEIVDESSSDIKDVDPAKFKAVLDVMSTQLGSPYVYGGAGEIITAGLIANLQKLYPTQQYSVPAEFYDSTWRAFDCSGLMQWGFNNIGVKINRNTSAQLTNGVEVSLDKVQPGDLLFYKTLGHVGMYIGDDKWIESPRTGLNVRITNVPWNLIGRARRVI